MSVLLDAALAYAAEGTPVFPCIPGGKKPLTEHGFHDATTDEATIRRWWADEPEANVAFSPHSVGLSVVDLDGPEPAAAWDVAVLENGGTTDTKTVLTPREGGVHLYYEGELPPTQSKLGFHIDTRGRGSYALLPPSVIDGRSTPDEAAWGSYRYLKSPPPAPVPEWIIPFLAALKKDKIKASGAAGLDEPGNVARAERLLRDYVARNHVAVEGEGGNTRTFAVACEVQNFGVSPETAFKLLSDIWNPACVPPWDDADLETLVANAASYAENEAGAWAVGAPSEVFGSVLGSLGLDEPEEPRRSRFHPMSMRELAALPPPTWLIPELVPAERVTMFYGQPGSYKSFIVLMKALELAALGQSVIYVAGEGARELQVRADAWGLLHDIDVMALPIWIVGDMPWADDGSMLAEFIEEVRPFKPALVILDTVARAMVGLNENDAKDMGTFVAFADTIKKALKTAVAVVHHSGKDDTRGPRGSHALVGAVDAAHEVKADKKTHTVEVWVRRMKDAAERERPWTYRAQPLAQSLVFIETTPGEHRTLTHVEEIASPRMVGAALKRLGAIGDINGVATRVLAAELTPPADDQSPEAREQAVGRLARALTARASDTLEAYALGEGRERSWFLPSAAG